MIQKRLAKLIDVKSILTIVLSCVFGYLAITGAINPSDFQTVFLMVITYYFTRKTEGNEMEMPVDKE